MVIPSVLVGSVLLSLLCRRLVLEVFPQAVSSQMRLRHAYCEAWLLGSHASHSPEDVFSFHTDAGSG